MILVFLSRLLFFWKVRRGYLRLYGMTATFCQLDVFCDFGLFFFFFFVFFFFFSFSFAEHPVLSLTLDSWTTRVSDSVGLSCVFR